jgi:hypothetical protein
MRTGLVISLFHVPSSSKAIAAKVLFTLQKNGLTTPLLTGLPRSKLL